MLHVCQQLSVWVSMLFHGPTWSDQFEEEVKEKEGPRFERRPGTWLLRGHVIVFVCQPRR